LIRLLKTGKIPIKSFALWLIAILRLNSNKKSRLILFTLFVISLSCSKQEIQDDQTTQNALEPLSGIEINRLIKTSVEKNGKFSWNDADDYVLWSAAMHGDSILTIGYGSSSFDTQKSTNNNYVKSQIMDLLRDIEFESPVGLKSDEKLLVYEDEVLNYFDVKISGIESVKALRKCAGVRYIDASGYRFYNYESGLKSDSGCDTDAGTVNSDDYRTITPGCLVSWVYDKHNIPAAWNLSTGTGVGFGLIDTGVSSSQSLLGSSFNDGYSSGRTISKYGVYINSIWPWVTTTDGSADKCGHGTLMAANIASPRNDNNLPVGVAYNCNLVAFRATSDVVLDGYQEQKGVAKALTTLGSRSDVKVISMSIGHIISIGSIEDGIRYAYAQGKLIFAAGGTSTTFTNWVGVIFPAWMSETVAITGIKDGGGFTECAVCHKGSKIDFTVIMERSGDDSRHSVCLGFYEGTKTYVGGSSVSTSTVAGIAALVWARYPSWTRSQVLQRLKESASLYPNKDVNFGYGSINAYLAVQ
jgi:serine protease